MESENNGRSESEAEVEDPTNRKARNRTLSPFILPLLPVILAMQFSLDRKQRSHKRNRCSASVSLILTRLYHFTLLITTPTTTLSLVKTSLYMAIATIICVYVLLGETRKFESFFVCDCELRQY